jgi:peptidoglycan/LPS O-acetylase OafA/YrhL
LESPLQYNPALDGLRAIAAMLVVANHCHVPSFGGGFLGVDVFFVLSGFLITRLLVEEFGARGRIDLPGFYLRRILRLTPPLLLMLAAYLAAAPVLWPQLDLSAHVRDAGLVGFYLSDYALAFWGCPMVLLHSWSLAVEEHFYLIWPLAILLLARIQLRWRIALLIGIYILATAWRIFEYERVDWAQTYYRFDTRMSGLAFGALLAIGLPRVGRISEETANAAGTFACIALISCVAISWWRDPRGLVWMMSVVEIAAAALLIAASVQTSWVSALLSTPPLVGIGVISYSVYLWHYPLALFLREQLPWYQTTPLVLTFALTVATISYLIVERPLQRYRRSLGARRRGTGAANNERARAPVRAAATTVP